MIKPGDEAHEFYSAPAIGFIVEDVRAARAVMEARGAEFVGEVHDGTPGETWGSAWSHFKLPDGYVYALVSRPEQSPAARRGASASCACASRSTTSRPRRSS